MIEKNVKTKKSLLTIEEVLEATGGIHVLGNGEFCFTTVQTDSRNVDKDCLFVPLIGENQDGHNYVKSAIENGASVVFVCLKNYEKTPQYFTEISLKNPEIFFIGVENTLIALQQIAECYVSHFPNLIRIGITGSSGKTTTKEICASILKQKYSVVTNKGNLNSETGLPLSVFEIRPEHQLGIFEMGMNRENEIAELSRILKPRLAIITNIGSAHIGKLGNRENIAKEKARIFDYFKGIGTAFIPKNDDFSSYLKSQVDGNVIFYGDDCDSAIRFDSDLGLEGTSFFVDDKKVILNLPGKYNYSNALSAIAVAKFLGLNTEQIVCGIENVKGLFGRSEILHGNYTIIQDCYNANPDSMEKAIEFASSLQLKNGQKLFIVLGDMLELGDSEKECHEKIGKQLSELKDSICLFCGKRMDAAYKEMLKVANPENLFAIQENDDSAIEKIVQFIKGKIQKDDIVLIKASRSMQLERITELLECKNV